MSVVARIAAVLVAVGLVFGAVVVRQRQGADAPATVADGPAAGLAAGCPDELRDLCLLATPAGDVDWQPARAAAHAAALAEDRAAAVLLPAEWADVADDQRARAGRAPLTRSEVVARTPMLLVAFGDRARVLAEACGVAVDALDWACVGEHAGRRWEDLGGDVRWGSVVVGHAPPSAATGLLATTAVVAARTGTPFALRDLRDPGVSSWFRRLERAVDVVDPPGGSHMTAMVTRGPSVANVATATEAEAVTRGRETAFGALVLIAPEPLFEVELVVAGTDPDLVARIASAIDPDAVAGAGWRTGSTPPAGAPVAELPPVTPRPSGGVLTAVRSTWEEVTG